MASAAIILITLGAMIFVGVWSPDYLPPSSFSWILMGIFITGVAAMSGVILWSKKSQSFEPRRTRSQALACGVFAIGCLGATAYACHAFTRPSLEHVRTLISKMQYDDAEGMWCQMLDPLHPPTHTALTCPVGQTPLRASEDAMVAMDELLANHRDAVYQSGEDLELKALKRTHEVFERFGLDAWLPKSRAFHLKWVKQKYELCGQKCYTEYIDALRLLPGTKEQRDWLQERAAIVSLGVPEELLGWGAYDRKLDAIDAWNAQLERATYRAPTPEQHATIMGTRVAARVIQRVYNHPISFQEASLGRIDTLLSRQGLYQRVLHAQEDREVRVVFDPKGHPVGMLFVNDGQPRGFSVMERPAKKIPWSKMFGPSSAGTWGEVAASERNDVRAQWRAHRRMMRAYEEYVRSKLGPEHDDKAFTPYHYLHRAIRYERLPKGINTWESQGAYNSLALIQRNVAYVDQNYFPRDKRLGDSPKSWPVMGPSKPAPTVGTSSASSDDGDVNTPAGSSSFGTPSVGFGGGPSFRGSSTSSGRLSSGSGGFSSGKN